MFKNILNKIYMVKGKDYDNMGLLKKTIMLACVPLVVIWAFLILFVFGEGYKLTEKVEWAIFGIIVGAVAIGLSMLISNIILAI